MSEPGNKIDDFNASRPDNSETKALKNSERPADLGQKLETSLGAKKQIDEVRQKVETDLLRTQQNLDDVRKKLGLPQKSAENPYLKLEEKLSENEKLINEQEKKFLDYPEKPESFENQTAQKSMDFVGMAMVKEMREQAITDFIEEMKVEFFKKFESHLNDCVNKDRAVELMNLKIEDETKEIATGFLDGKTDELNCDFLAQLQISYFKTGDVKKYYVTGFTLEARDAKTETNRQELVGKDEKILKQAEREGILEKDKIK